MTGEQQHGEREGASLMGGGRQLTYCIVPSELAGELHELLRRHFRDDPAVEVIVERRLRERRFRGERRKAEGEAPTGEERRRVTDEGGRRIGERRARATVVEPPPGLPRRARRHAERLVFVLRAEPADQRTEDLDTARLVARVQGGDSDAFGLLYSRYFARVYGYLRLVLRNTQDAEDAAQDVFMKAFEALPRYERRRQPFRAWLFTIARNHAVSQLRKEHDLPLEPAELDRRREEAQPDLDALRAVSDRDFMILIERLPLPQRQVLALRFMLDLNSAEIGAIVGREPGAVRALQHRAMRTLEARLTPTRRGGPERPQRAPMKSWPKRAPVLRARKYSL